MAAQIDSGFTFRKLIFLLKLIVAKEEAGVMESSTSKY